MRYLLSLILCISWTIPCHASSCKDMQDSVSTAIQERNGRTTDMYNVMIPDPESERGMFSSCLDTVNSVGDAFTLGVTLPGMDQILENMCNQVNSYIQQKINDAHNEVLNTVSGIGGNNVFKVYGTGGDYIVKVTDRLQ